MKKHVYDKDAKFAVLANPANPANPDIIFGIYYGELKPGDLVVCNHYYSDNMLSVRVVKVSDAAPETDVIIECEIMGVCDVTEYRSRKDKMEHYAELKRQIVAQAEKYQQEEYWPVLSEFDPTIKALYEELRTPED